MRFAADAASRFVLWALFGGLLFADAYLQNILTPVERFLLRYIS